MSAERVEAIRSGLLETCREWGEDEPQRCGRPAEFILWGKLLPKEAFGPRCYDHAVKHLGQSFPSRVDQYAVYDLRPVAALVAAETDGLAERVAALADNCVEIVAMRVDDPWDRGYRAAHRKMEVDLRALLAQPAQSEGSER